MASLFRSHSNTDVNKTYIFGEFIQSLVVVWSTLPNRPQGSKVLASQIWLACCWEIQSSHLKELVKFGNQRNFLLLACNIEGDISLQKLQNFWVAKWSHTFFVKLCVFKHSSQKKYLTHQAQICSESYSCHLVSVFITDIVVAQSEI